VECCRDGERLVMEDAHLFTESPPRGWVADERLLLVKARPPQKLAANSLKTKKANHRQPVKQHFTEESYAYPGKWN